MPEQDLDHQPIRPDLQKVCREAVPQRVQRAARFLDSRDVLFRTEGPVDLARKEGLFLGMPGSSHPSGRTSHQYSRTRFCNPADSMPCLTWISIRPLRCRRRAADTTRSRVATNLALNTAGSLRGWFRNCMCGVIPARLQVVSKKNPAQ